MRRIGEIVLAALAAFVAVAAAVRRPASSPGPPRPLPSVLARREVPTSSLAMRIAETGPAQAKAVGFVSELVDAVRRHRLVLLAAGLAYYAFFTMFPLAIAAISIYGLIGDPADIERILDQMADVFPGPTAEFLEAQLQSLIDAPPRGLGVATVLSLIALLWSASAGARALMGGIEAVYEETRPGRGLMMRVWALASTLVLLLVGIVMVAAAAFLPTLFGTLGFGDASIDLARWARWPVLLVLVAAGLTVLYRSSPGSSFGDDGWFSMGAVVATVAIVLMTLGLGLVVGYGSYTEVYGALTGLAVLMLWFFTAGLIILIGAEVDRMINENRRASVR